MPRSLAQRISRPATSRTWPTEPGAPVSWAACSTCTESTTHTSGCSASTVAITVSRSVSAMIGTSSAPAAQALGAQAHLRRRLLAGDVEHVAAGRDQVAQRGGGDGGLADAGRAAQQHQRAGHDAPAQDAVELADAGREARDVRRLDAAQRHGLDGRAGAGRAAARAAPARRAAPRAPRLLDEGAPLLAGRAAAVPLGGLVRAGRADVDGGGLGHALNLGRGVDGLAPASTRAVQPVRARALPWPAVDLLDQPCATAEYLVVDTETNGRGGDLCELTEVGAVLVGGGELHDTFESLVAVERPLSRGIERLTGITQQMVDTAPPPAEVLGELAAPDGGPRAGGPQRLVRLARAGAGVRARGPGLARPARAVHRRAGAQVRAAGAPAQAGPAGRRAGHRRGGGAPRAARRHHVRADPVRAVPAPVRGGADGGRRRGGADLGRGAAAAGSAPEPRGPAGARRTGPTCGTCPRTPACTCSATSAGGRCTWASRCRCARARGRTSAPRRAGPSAPRWPTTGPRTPSWARWCWRTG